MRRNNIDWKLSLIWIEIVFMTLLAMPNLLLAHCDTKDGPVVVDAVTALKEGKVEHVLKWVKPEYEQEIRTLFAATVKLRKKGKDAREIADQHFFETLVRLHRAGEGAPFTGLKPAGKVEPIVALSDKALEKESADALVGKISAHISAEIQKRFKETVEAKKHKDESVESGRAFVAAYVDFMHYVEGIHEAAMKTGHGHDDAGHEPSMKHNH